MTAKATFKVETGTLTADEFVFLSQVAGWGRDRKFVTGKVTKALKASTLTVVVRDRRKLAVGCGRAFSDDLLMTFVPDIFVHPDYQKMGVGRLIMEEITGKFAHTSFFMGAQTENEGFFERLGFTRSLQSFGGKVARNKL